MSIKEKMSETSTTGEIAVLSEDPRYIYNMNICRRYKRADASRQFTNNNTASAS